MAAVPRLQRRDLIHFILLPCLLFVLIPAFVLKENIDDLASFDPRAFFFLALAAGAVSIVLLSIDWLVRRATGGAAFSEIVRYVCLFVVTTGFVLPASKSSGMRDPRLLEIDTVHVVLASLLALALAFASRSVQRSSFSVALIVFVSFNAATCIPALYSLSSASESDDRSIFKVSSERNILVLSFDGVSGSAVREVLGQHPEIERSFSGFVFYDKVASSSLATSASTVASLYGNQNFKEKYDTEGQLWKSAPRRLLTNYLNENGFEVSTYGIYNKGFAERSRRHSMLAPRPPASVLTLLNYSLARALTRFGVFRGGLARQLEDWTQEALTPRGAEARDLRRKMSSSQAPKWKWGRLTPTVLDYREYVRRLDVAAVGPVAHFAHFTYSHYPVEFDGDCRFKGHDPDWFAARQNWMGAREEARCVLKQAGQFIERLKALGVFDRSLVVLKSDHGKPWRYGEPGSLESAPIRGHRNWGYGRYRPFLAIKDFGRGHHGVRHDLHPVMLDDLAKTLCRNSGIASDCAAYGGYDLLGDDLTDMESAEVTLFVVKSQKSTYRYETQEAITIERGVDVVASLCTALAGEPGSPDVNCDES